MSIILKSQHHEILRRARRFHVAVHFVLVVIFVLMMGVNWFWQGEAVIARESYGLARESYEIFKMQFESVLFRQKIYSLLRSKSLTIGQAMDVVDIILGQDRIPVPLVLAMISVESDFDPDAASNKGAKGLTQIMPVIRKIYSNHSAFRHDVKQVHEVSINVRMGLQFLGDLHEQFGDWDLALQAYNAGPERVKKNAEAIRYAKIVLRRAVEFENKLRT